MDLNNIRRQVFSGLRDELSKEDRQALVSQLADELGVSGSTSVKHGDTVQTDQGLAVAVVLTPEEVLRRLSNG